MANLSNTGGLQGYASPGTAIVAIGNDPSSPGIDPSYYKNWLSEAQQGDHAQYTQVTPQACYANGDAHSPAGKKFPNEVAWVRGAEWVGRPGPDDSYISAQISTSDLASMASGSGKAIRMQFQLPTMPQIPCDDGCLLLGTEQLRYWSLSFFQPTSEADVLVSDPDGIGAASTKNQTLVSLADTAFVQAPGGYVTLIVGVGQSLSTLTTGTTGAMEGAEPIATTNGARYSVLQNPSTYYTFLDLTQFTKTASSPGFVPTQPLQLLIRNTLPNAAFSCSGAAVPFYTEEYTDSKTGAGLMGPYVPLIDYPLLSNLPPAANTSSGNLPSASFCGQLPDGAPTYNTGAGISYPNSIVQWPTYWPSSTLPAPQSLSCGTLSAPAPTIYFVTTQWPFTALASSSQLDCTAAQTNCTYLAGQSLPAALQSEGQPPLPVTIAGAGFGYLPQYRNSDGSLEMDLPFVPPAGHASSNFLEVYNDGAVSGNGGWDTASNPACQVYIANWTGTDISAEVSVPIDAYTAYAPSTPVSPINDASPLSFFFEDGQGTISQNTMGCPVATGDHLTFTVTNPQSLRTASIGPVTVN
jgi:hypothetical protein